MLDVAGALQRMANDMELYRDLVANFEKDAPRFVERLRHAVDASDMESVHRSAHSLKGLAQNVGAESVAASASELERAARAGDSLAAAVAYSRIEASMLRVKSQLGPYRRNSG